MEAELLYQGALQDMQRALGPDHPAMVQALNNLANLYRDQGKSTEAGLLFQRALRISKRSQRARHPDVAISLTGLANLSHEQGNDAEAERLFQRALRLQEQQSGQYHPRLAETLHDLAIFRQQRGNLDEATSLAERALSIRSQSLGDAHPKTLASRTLFAQLGKAREDIQDGGPFPGDTEEIPRQGRKGPAGEEEYISPQKAIERRPPESHPPQEFLDACCELHPRAWCRSADLWQAYRDWVKERQEPLSPLPTRVDCAVERAWLLR